MIQHKYNCNCPTISVILSVYNGSKYVGMAIQSILKQTYSNFEFIIINDGSLDNTLEVIKNFDDSRIILINQENQGLTKALNNGIKISKGKYIARIDADDVCLSGRFEKQLTAMENDKHIGLIGSYDCFFDVRRSEIDIKVRPVNSKDIKVFLAKYGTPFSHSSVMMRREAIERVGYYNESYKQAQDYELWIRIAKYYKLANIPECLCITRRNVKNSIVTKRSKIVYMLIMFALQTKAIRHLSFSKAYYFFLILTFLRGILPRAVLDRLVRKQITDLKSKILSDFAKKKKVNLVFTDEHNCIIKEMKIIK